MVHDDDSLNRLESALDRIEKNIEQPDPVAGEVASRLDAVIARLRTGLAGAEG
jgi:tetrahydromethanopterin S-methyltransferase subunit G